MKKNSRLLVMGLSLTTLLVTMSACDPPKAVGKGVSTASSATFKNQDVEQTPQAEPDATMQPDQTAATSEPAQAGAATQDMTKQAEADTAAEENTDLTKQTIDIPTDWTRLSKEEEIWIDAKKKEVIIAGSVCFNQGPLEMFICPRGTKEHESVIAANALSRQVHAALVAIGADHGKPCSWDPEYRPAHGPSIKVTLIWVDDTGKQIKMPAEKWIRNSITKKQLDQDWVFGGSQFWTDPDTGRQVYFGDSGELICLSNFSTATIDLAVESSQSNDGLLFEAFTENIPSVGTKVYAIIKPGKIIELKAKPSDTEEGDDTHGETDGAPSIGAPATETTPKESSPSSEPAPKKNTACGLLLEKRQPNAPA